jgi:RNA-directed DNA polymerase
MEDYIRNCNGMKTRYSQPHLIRYADDFIILHKDEKIIGKCKEAIISWLQPLGLELKPSKTRICHTLHEYNGEKAGFDFLGFNIKHYPTTKNRALRTKGKNLGVTLTIKPSKEKVKEHSLRLRETVRKYKSMPQNTMIAKLNPIISGWCNYYSTVVSKKTFSLCDYLLWEKLRAWAKHRHPNKSTSWIKNKYWKVINNRKVFATRNDNTGYRLKVHADTPIKRFVKVQSSRSPYDGDWVYWSSRMGKNPLVSNKVATLLKKQKGICPICNNYLKPDDIMETDHITPKSLGGKNTLNNLQILHKHCHDSKTAEDGSYIGCTDDNSYPIEERNDGKLSRSVLKTSRSGDTSA